MLHNSELRHKTTWDPSCIGVRIGKRIFNLRSLRESKSWDKKKVDELDGWGQMTWNHPSTKVYTLFKHGMGNNLLIEFLN